MLQWIWLGLNFTIAVLVIVILAYLLTVIVKGTR